MDRWTPRVTKLAAFLGALWKLWPLIHHLFCAAIVDTGSCLNSGGSDDPPVQIIVHAQQQIPAGWNLSKCNPWFTFGSNGGLSRGGE